ncbi:F/Y-rich N-terminus-domain-containing protein [Mucor mucedo]|uniref:F/Y-rich N-terminus-domain-containing protein n=1 Tax=Mucor mucedo TaxID=29922 RepID=UPI00221E9B70|nr:F/Y-rich N-terminus-domain-containing protein [Mucor mucedo]KAI7893768.1 F/Y-rich N-terminus-domain-containing protein [Mucor mucedo]
MKWVKEDYFSALRNKSFEQFRISTQTPHHPICNCYHTDESEFDRYQRQSSPPLPTRVPVFRPEPIFPQNKRQNSPPFYNQQDNNLTLPYPKKDNPAIMPASSSSSANANNNNHNNNNNNNNNNISSSSSSNNTAIPAPLPTPTSDPSSRIYQKTPVQPPPAPPQQQQQQQQQQVNTVVRTYYEVDRDNTGAYILPVEIDSWTVVDLGTVIYERPAYHNQRYIYPANYTVRKWYRSMVDPKSDTQYTCRILENGREPKFEVTADDCPMTYSGPTPTTVWTIIVRRAFAIRNQEYGHNPVGPDFFGLRKNTIAKMIQDLPNASKCSQYVWQTFEPARFNKPGRNRRRADSTLPGSLLGGVNYGLTSSRLIHNTNLSSTQHAYRANSTPSSPTNDHCTTIVETA